MWHLFGTLHVAQTYFTKYAFNIQLKYFKPKPLHSIARKTPLCINAKNV